MAWLEYRASNDKLKLIMLNDTIYLIQHFTPNSSLLSLSVLAKPEGSY